MIRRTVPTRRRIRVLLIFVVVLAAAVVYFLSNRGVRVVVHNRGLATLHDVHVKVTGRSMVIGDLRPDESRGVNVEPTGKSQIELTFMDDGKMSEPLVIDCYLGPSHYSGHITIDLAGDRILNVDNQIRPSRW